MDAYTYTTNSLFMLFRHFRGIFCVFCVHLLSTQYHTVYSLLCCTGFPLGFLCSLTWCSMSFFFFYPSFIFSQHDIKTILSPSVVLFFLSSLPRCIPGHLKSRGSVRSRPIIYNVLGEPFPALMNASLQLLPLCFYWRHCHSLMCYELFASQQCLPWGSTRSRALHR